MKILYSTLIIALAVLILGGYAFKNWNHLYTDRDDCAAHMSQAECNNIVTVTIAANDTSFIALLPRIKQLAEKTSGRILKSDVDLRTLKIKFRHKKDALHFISTAKPLAFVKLADFEPDSVLDALD